MKRPVLAMVFGASAIACVAGPFAVVGQRHAPKDAPPPPVTHTTPVAMVAAVESASATPPPAPVAPMPHTFRVADLAADSRVSVVNGTVGKHGFLGAIIAAGLSPKEAHRVLVGFSGVRNLDRANPSDTFTFAKAQDGHVVAFELLSAGAMDGDTLEFLQEHEKTEGERLAATRISLPIERKRVKAGIVVGEALRSSLASAALREEATDALDDALDGHAELSDLRAGTRLRIVATEQRIEGNFVGYAPIDAVEYTPPSHDGGGKPAIRVYWYPKGSSSAHVHGGFYDAQGKQPYHGGWRSPVPMARISSRFNPNRMHPVLHVIMPHNGIDFAAPAGTPVYAASAGTIRSAGDGGPCGNMVQIEHGGGLISAYCHLSRFGPIAAGQHVEARQLIGYVGQTGRATGPHLHFAVKRLNAAGIEQFIDPMVMKLDGVRVVPPRLRGDFDELKKTLDAEIDSITLPEAPAQTAPAEPQTESEETE